MNVGVLLLLIQVGLALAKFVLPAMSGVSWWLVLAPMIAWCVVSTVYSFGLLIAALLGKPLPEPEDRD